MKPAEVAATVAPSLGPTIVTMFGTDVPVLSLALSGVGLLLARVIAPAPLRPLTTRQHLALTSLLLVVLFVIVTGQFTGTPLQPGLAVAWGVGLGFSGLVAVEFFGDRTLAMLKAMFGSTETKP